MTDFIQFYVATPDSEVVKMSPFDQAAWIVDHEEELKKRMEATGTTASAVARYTAVKYAVAAAKTFLTDQANRLPSVKTATDNLVKVQSGEALSTEVRTTIELLISIMTTLRTTSPMFIAPSGSAPLMSYTTTTQTALANKIAAEKLLAAAKAAAEANLLLANKIAAEQAAKAAAHSALQKQIEAEKAAKAAAQVGDFFKKSAADREAKEAAAKAEQARRDALKAQQDADKAKQDAEQAKAVHEDKPGVLDIAKERVTKDGFSLKQVPTWGWVAGGAVALLLVGSLLGGRRN